MTRDEELESLKRKRAASERMGDGYKARIEAIDKRIAELEPKGGDLADGADRAETKLD
jgi:hypothetical protein